MVRPQICAQNISIYFFSNSGQYLYFFITLGYLSTIDAGCEYVLTSTDYNAKFVDFSPLKEKGAAGVSRSFKTFLC